MEAYTIARVVLMPNGDIHIVYHNRQTYYCTARALLLLLSDPLEFLERGKDFLDISTYLLNKNQDSVDKVQGLTLLTVYSDKRFVGEFPELFKLIYSPYILSTSEADQNMNMSLENLQSFPRDDKQDLIRLYMAYTQSAFVSGQRKKHRVDISAETQSKIVSEIINTSIKATIKRAEKVEDIQSTLIILNKKANIQDKVVDKDEDFEETMIITSNDSGAKEKKANDRTSSSLITIEEYAAKYGKKVQTIKEWGKKGKIQSIYRDTNKQYWVDANETAIDLRANRRVAERNDGTGRKCVRLLGNSYTDLQKYIEERGLVTSNVRLFIRSYEEVKYYEKHNYHEVKWETGSALIIDINPDYYCKTEGKTNREIIAAGGSPVVPQNEGYKFHLHHIGQQSESPFAIIPEYDHNSIALYSIFHRGKSSAKDLHDKSYEEQKHNFWKAYLKYYDQYGSFSKIPYLNPKRKRNQVK